MTMNFSEASYRKPKINPCYRTDEIWTRIPLVDANGYWISNYGRVYNESFGHLAIPFVTNVGYAEVKIHGKNMAVHRLVALSFHSSPSNWEELDVNHKDGNKLNNFAENLEWGTRSYNIQEAFRLGLARKGEAHPNNVYTESQIQALCAALENQQDIPTVCAQIGLTYGSHIVKLVYKLRHGKAWKDITKNFNISKQ